MENYEEIHLPWPGWKIGKYLGGGAYGKNTSAGTQNAYEEVSETIGIKNPRVKNYLISRFRKSPKKAFLKYIKKLNPEAAEEIKTSK